MKEKSEIFLKLYTLLFGSGMAKDLRPVNCTTLLAIASFIDDKGNCCPTQIHIAEVTGMSTATVNKAVNALLEFKVNGKSIITREFVQQAQFTYSYYTFHLI
ncbi:helix-turn-helix domain-containing protein [Sporosarcina sp. SG10008]|uniref:helix-turn-helix domain-containing protein n=1 Tax=Sporosarcina sp. SG10008 TaxID=3373103 RepID=UPI0037DCEC28